MLTWVSVFSSCFGPLVPFWQRQAIGIKSDTFGMSGILHFCKMCKCILSRLGTSQTHWCFEANYASKRQGKWAAVPCSLWQKECWVQVRWKKRILLAPQIAFFCRVPLSVVQSWSSPISPREWWNLPLNSSRFHHLLLLFPWCPILASVRNRFRLD